MRASSQNGALQGRSRSTENISLCGYEGAITARKFAVESLRSEAHKGRQWLWSFLLTQVMM